MGKHTFRTTAEPERDYEGDEAEITTVRGLGILVSVDGVSEKDRIAAEKAEAEKLSAKAEKKAEASK